MTLDLLNRSVANQRDQIPGQAAIVRVVLAIVENRPLTAVEQRTGNVGFQLTLDLPGPRQANHIEATSHMPNVSWTEAVSSIEFSGAGCRFAGPARCAGQYQDGEKVSVHQPTMQPITLPGNTGFLYTPEITKTAHAKVGRWNDRKEI